MNFDNVKLRIYIPTPLELGKTYQLFNEYTPTINRYYIQIDNVKVQLPLHQYMCDSTNVFKEEEGLLFSLDELAEYLPNECKILITKKFEDYYLCEIHVSNISKKQKQKKMLTKTTLIHEINTEYKMLNKWKQILYYFGMKFVTNIIRKF